MKFCVFFHRRRRRRRRKKNFLSMERTNEKMRFSLLLVVCVCVRVNLTAFRQGKA